MEGGRNPLGGVSSVDLHGPLSDRNNDHFTQVFCKWQGFRKELE